MTDHIGISRKVENDEDRQRLREEIEKLRPQDAGFIVRTVAENASREDLEADMEFLLHLWGEIQDQASKAPVPSLVYEDLDITQRAVRDLFTPDIQRVVVDDQATYEKVCNFVETFVPQLRNRVSHYDNEIPLLDAYGVEIDVSRALEKKVWLRSGGYIIIETTEALTVVDVNTGRYVGRKDLEETIFKTNMEAAKEIAYQLRLRNIGGIIIIDFIDMEIETNREEVFNSLQEAVKKDKSRANILKVSEFGLVQMTRKRDRENLSQMMCEPCMYCEGEGILKSRRSICYEIFRRLTHDSRKMQGDTVTLKVHPSVADLMLKDETLNTENLEKEIQKRFIIVPDSDMYLEKYEIIWQKN
jgi:ribonuclease G